MTARLVWTGLCFAVTVAMVLVLNLSCASLSTHAARVQGAVTVLAEIVDPAYELAVDGCIARERMEVAAERDGGQAPQTTDEHLHAIRARCDEVTSAFRTMRTLLAEAEHALDAGHAERAEAELEKVRATWARLRP